MKRYLVLNAQKYYDEWEKIAKCCYDSDYIELFNKSRLLITDCNSFLVEYFCTGKPLVHLVSKDTALEPYEYNKKIMDSFYKVNSADELHLSLDSFAKQNLDPLKTERQRLLGEYGFINKNYSKKIIEDLVSAIRIA